MLNKQNPSIMKAGKEWIMSDERSSEVSGLNKNQILNICEITGPENVPVFDKYKCNPYRILCIDI